MKWILSVLVLLGCSLFFSGSEALAQDSGAVDSSTSGEDDDFLSEFEDDDDDDDDPIEDLDEEDDDEDLDDDDEDLDDDDEDLDENLDEELEENEKTVENETEEDDDDDLTADLEEEDDLFDIDEKPEILVERPVVNSVSPKQVEAPMPREKLNTSLPNKITRLSFLGKDKGGTVVIETTRPVDYTARRNPRDKQLVIEIANTKIPRRFTRPLVTKDFPSSIGSINAYQPIGSDKTFVVVQMKGDRFPTIQQTENRILLAVLDSQEAAENASILKKDLSEFLLSEQRFYGKKISIQVGETSVRDVLNLISDQSGVNMMISNDVKGTTSIRLRNTPWDQALILVLQSNQLGYVRQGSVLRIATLERLKGEAAAIKEAMEDKKKALPLVLKVIQVNYAKVTGMAGQLQKFISERGRLSVDVRTNSILVNDLPERVAKIEKLIETLDYSPPQVLIEGKVVEAQSNFTRALGINWGASGSPVQIGTNTDGGSINFTPSLAISPTGAGVGASGFNFNLNIGTLDLLGDLSARLAIEERESKVKVVSSPRIVTLTNEEAVIIQTTEIPLITTSVSEGVATKGVSFTTVRLELKVTPLVTSDNSIILDVHLTREFAGEIVDSDTQARPINKRSAKTKVLVQNGSTAVIGGIYQSDATESSQGVPYLRKIPILGRFFESTSRTKERNELMVFLTPRVLGEPGNKF